MKKADFESFLAAVYAAQTYSLVWHMEHLWEAKLTPKQAATLSDLLDFKPEVQKIERSGAKIYIIPGGREWRI